MPGSLFREWKVALAFVAGIAVLAGAFVSEGGEHRYFAELKQRSAAAEPEPAPPAAAARPASPVQPRQADPGQFASDAELESQFEDPAEAEMAPGSGGLPVVPAADTAPMTETGGEAEGSAAVAPAVAVRPADQEP